MRCDPCRCYWLGQELSPPAIGPGVVFEGEANPVGDWWMVIEQENVKPIWFRIPEIDVTKHVEGLRRHLPRISRQAVRHFKAVLVRLVLVVTVDRIGERVQREREDREKEHQDWQGRPVIDSANPPVLPPARQRPFDSAIAGIEYRQQYDGI